MLKHKQATKKKESFSSSTIKAVHISPVLYGTPKCGIFRVQFVWIKHTANMSIIVNVITNRPRIFCWYVNQNNGKEMSPSPPLDCFLTHHRQGTCSNSVGCSCHRMLCYATAEPLFVVKVVLTARAHFYWVRSGKLLNLIFMCLLNHLTSRSYHQQQHSRIIAVHLSDDQVVLRPLLFADRLSCGGDVLFSQDFIYSQRNDQWTRIQFLSTKPPTVYLVIHASS